MVPKSQDVVATEAVELLHEGFCVPDDHVHLLVAYTDLRLYLVFLLHEATVHALQELGLFLSLQDLALLVEVMDLLLKLQHARSLLLDFILQVFVLLEGLLLPVDE